MNYPSVKRISECLSVDNAIAMQIRGIIDGSTDPVTVGTDARQYVGSCFNRPSDYVVQLYAINELMQSYGVESFDSVHGTADYCNTGDSYTPTVLYFPSDGRFRVGCQGDYVKLSND